MDAIKTFCFSGPRSERLPQSENGLRCLAESVYNAIDAAVCAGFDTFIHGACYGFDLLCTEQILIRRRAKDLSLPLSTVLSQYHRAIKKLKRYLTEAEGVRL